ncbi:MAG TPA: energy transducer TonB [Saprospiraceae bacterium]|nr:energy transducer TonB [Saprospiraceae bacterium]HMQ84714.1 energy transducer TonB [Saprospiraceae bacterium]
MKKSILSLIFILFSISTALIGQSKPVSGSWWIASATDLNAGSNDKPFLFVGSYLHFIDSSRLVLSHEKGNLLVAYQQTDSRLSYLDQEFRIEGYRENLLQLSNSTGNRDLTIKLNPCKPLPEEELKALLDKSAAPDASLPYWDAKMSDAVGMAYPYLLIPNYPGAQEIYKVVEEMPRFPGCEDLPTKEDKKSCADKAMLTYVYKNLVYPGEAQRAGISGIVVASFIVEPDGTLSTITIVRSIGGGCDEAVIDVLQQMNEEGIVWTPGKMGGIPQRTLFNFPVKFQKK